MSEMVTGGINFGESVVRVPRQRHKVGDGVMPSREVAYKFYGTPAWRNCSKAYKKSVGGLCEKCKAKGLIVPGEIVHHKIELTADNIDDPSVTLSWSNLELVCRSCHAEEHGFTKRRYIVDELGRVTGRDIRSPL